MLTRRRFLTSASAAFTIASLPLHSQPANSFAALSSRLADVEKSVGGRLGVAILDARSNQRAGHREAERFAMCSTFKMLLAATILHRVDTDRESLGNMLPIPKTGLIPNSPVTSRYAGHSLLISDLCRAALTRSDNTAANILLARLGGPSAVTAFARSLGDTVTRLDRIEPELNDTHPGELRDTTSPAAMVGNLQLLLRGRALKPTSRQQLTDWMLANTTGTDRLLAGLPKSWLAADKTGSNGQDTTNDIGALWPPSHPPVLVAAYLTGCPGPESHRNAALAQIGKLIAEAIS
jgi:beta-lactamase class A